ncbi:MAG: Mannose-6-phosphate isomerase ManA [Prosthecobacter sp.]|nr:Mannose-6-phosphate isomerase ManA [Prosthecobacter sp.]
MWDFLIKFQPLLQKRLWGGHALERRFGKQPAESGARFGESWEICDRGPEQSVSRLQDGTPVTLHELWTRHREAVFGQALAGHASPRYPLLMKILDACDDLSIQVHPPASVAAELGGEPKTEMWYVAAAAPGAKVYAGLREGVGRAELEHAAETGNVAGCVRVLEPQAGDCLFIPSGLVHAIGAGLVIYEIQQNSDTTFRLFDWNRVGADGRPRELHVEESLCCIDGSAGVPVLTRGREVACEFFRVRPACAAAGCRLEEWAGMHLTLAVVHGTIRLGGQELKAGDFAIVPAAMSLERRREAVASGDAEWLEVSIP